MKKEIMNLFVRYANHISETVQYEKWSDDFCRSEVRENTLNFLSELRKTFDFNTLTKEDAIDLGFTRWNAYIPEDSSDTRSLYLIPFYMLPIIPIGLEVISIMGEKIVNDGHNLDNDHRYGLLAYGILL